VRYPCRMSVCFFTLLNQFTGFHKIRYDHYIIGEHPNLVKVKVKFSLCLTKYHTMKTYPMFNYAPRHEDAFRSGDTAPCILNSALHGGEWSALHPGCFTRRRKNPRYPLVRRLGGTQSQSGGGGTYLLHDA